MSTQQPLTYQRDVMGARAGRTHGEHSADELGSSVTLGPVQVLAYVADNFLGEHPVRVVKWPQQPTCQVAHLSASAAKSHTSAAPPPLLVATHARWVDVWRLGVEGDAPPLGARDTTVCTFITPPTHPHPTVGCTAGVKGGQTRGFSMPLRSSAAVSPLIRCAPAVSSLRKSFNAVLSPQPTACADWRMTILIGFPFSRPLRTGP